MLWLGGEMPDKHRGQAAATATAAASPDTPLGHGPKHKSGGLATGNFRFSTEKGFWHLLKKGGKKQSEEGQGI